MFSRASHSRLALLAPALLLPVAAGAQTHRVTKTETVTRAVGVYEWTGDLSKPDAARLVPVSLFIDGHLQDAGVYLARPVPFALGTGYVYSIERAGEPVGTLDLQSARNVVSRRDAEESPAGAWYGYGKFQPPPAVPKPPALHPTEHPSAIVATSADGRPHLGNRSSDSTSPATSSKPDSSTKPDGNPGAKSSPTPPPAAQPADTSSTAASTPPVSSDDPDRPHMSRRDTGTTPAGGDDANTPAGSPTATVDTADDPDRPTLRRRGSEDGAKSSKNKKGKKESGSGVTGPAKSLNDDPDRPTLRHGQADDTTETPPLTGTPANLRQAIAVSDPTTADTHLFSRGWESPAERTRILAAFEVLARPRATNYLTLNKLHPGRPQVIPATTAASAPGAAGKSAAAPAAAPSSSSSSSEDQGSAPVLRRGKPGTAAVSPTPAAPEIAPPAPPKASRPGQAPAIHPGPTALGPAGPLTLTAESLNGYTLSYGGLPTFVYSAIVPTREGPGVHLTLAAQQLPSGELQVALSSLTDDAHLDRTPWLRLVDAVDTNDSHRASFLFELRAQSSRQFALYSLVSAQAEQSFVTGVIE